MGVRRGTWPGLSERIMQRIKALGYVDDEGNANCYRFAVERGFQSQQVYKWRDGMTPDPLRLTQLAEALGVHPAWLLFGDEVTTSPSRRLRRVVGGLLLALALSSVVVEASPPGGEKPVNALPLIGTRRRYRWPLGAARLLAWCSFPVVWIPAEG